MFLLMNVQIGSLKGEIVSVIQGRAEFGPRALGNRSLLCAPTDDNIKKLRSN
jgi:predicted NodU family carbamoyl transferase